jgi:hypothetical protein
VYLFFCLVLTGSLRWVVINISLILLSLIVLSLCFMSILASLGVSLHDAFSFCLLSGDRSAGEI